MYSPVRLFGATPGAVVTVSSTEAEILFDPGGWREGYDSRVPEEVDLPEELRSAPGLFDLFGWPDPDITLVTHHHTDHAKHGDLFGEPYVPDPDRRVVERRYSYGARPADEAPVVETVRTGHTAGSSAYVMEAGSVRVMFTGDVSPEVFLRLSKRLDPVDVLVMECSGVPGHAYFRHLEKACEVLRPKLVVPVHMISYRPEAVADLDVDAAVVVPDFGLEIDVSWTVGAEVPCLRRYHLCEHCERGRGCPVFRFARDYRCPRCGNPVVPLGDDPSEVTVLCPKCGRREVMSYREFILRIADAGEPVIRSAASGHTRACHTPDAPSPRNPPRGAF